MQILALVITDAQSFTDVQRAMSGVAVSFYNDDSYVLHVPPIDEDMVPVTASSTTKTMPNTGRVVAIAAERIGGRRRRAPAYRRNKTPADVAREMGGDEPSRIAHYVRMMIATASRLIRGIAEPVVTRFTRVADCLCKTAGQRALGNLSNRLWKGRALWIGSNEVEEQWRTNCITTHRSAMWTNK